ncbi:sigma-70 family RNA polymerase sigma factor [Roseomonas sp. 18066]|uniref:sigma-70 family RNA polymerase sigma factor n=1 Tax=Roseomonas sp. 18066 TaxID=2681412 RepID=UPI001358AE63|nr:sigma-70 family RNA polymerase sigma factor [Roseomonas sp. 18066]
MTSPLAAFLNLYRERSRLIRYADRLVGSRATGADLVQDVFLRLWERSAGRGYPDPAYVTRSVRNAALDHLRAERLRDRHAEEALPPGAADLEAQIDARQAIALIDTAIRALPERTRHIFLLNRIHGRSYREIGAVMQISSTAVENHMARALAACRAALDSPGTGQG